MVWKTWWNQTQVLFGDKSAHKQLTANDSIVHLQTCQEVPAVSVGVMIDRPNEAKF